MNTQLIKGSRGAMNGITNSMQNFGLLSEGSGKYLQIANYALQASLGIAEMLNILIQLLKRGQAAETAKAAALTSVNMTNPAGWAKIALATSVSALATAGLTVLVDKVFLGGFDLSTTAGRSEAVEAVQGVV